MNKPVDEIKTWPGQEPDKTTPVAESASSPSSAGSPCTCPRTCESLASVDHETPCCGSAVVWRDWSIEPDNAPWIVGSIDTPAGAVLRISTTLNWRDRLNGWRVRWAIGRMGYCVKPRLYAAGTPTADSPVFVSANYKMSFDRLRAALAGIDAWILVLDTNGINVWCAAGKGTFGTDELTRRVEATRLAAVVSHRRLIVPQLGAPGVAAHEVRKRTGFRVMYGPVRAADLPAFVQSGMKATPEMRRVEFNCRDRLAVVPVELVMSAKYVLLISAAFLLLAGFGSDGYAVARIASRGLTSVALFLGAVVCGTVLGPLLLPWLPGRALSAKGACIGVAMTAGLGAWVLLGAAETPHWLTLAAWAVALPLTTSFALMNYTGATTYTSLSGVRREMRVALPLQIIGALVGAVLWIAAGFVS